MIKLIPYSSEYEEVTISRITGFYGFHDSLVLTDRPTEVDAKPQYEESRKTLIEWLNPANALYMILEDGISVGFSAFAIVAPTWHGSRIFLWMRAEGATELPHTR